MLSAKLRSPHRLLHHYVKWKCRYFINSIYYIMALTWAWNQKSIHDYRRYIVKINGRQIWCKVISSSGLPVRICPTGLETFPCRLQCLYSLVMMLSSSIGLVSSPSSKSWCISMKKTYIKAPRTPPRKHAKIGTQNQLLLALWI